MGKKRPWKILKEGRLGTRPNWDEGFMADAIRASSRASCFKVHSGSVIVYNKRIIGTGYNGAMRVGNDVREYCKEVEIELIELGSRDAVDKVNEKMGRCVAAGIHLTC